MSYETMSKMSSSRPMVKGKSGDVETSSKFILEKGPGSRPG